MSKTVLAVGEIVGGALLAATGFGAIALPWALNAALMSTMASVGVGVGMSGVFGLLQSILNPKNTSISGSQQNLSNSAAYRRVVYGEVEVGGVLTFDSAPSGNKPYQDPNDGLDWRHQVYTLAGHQITSFGRKGIMAVVIENVFTKLQRQSDGYWVPVDQDNPWYGQNGPHVAFEFDTGNPASTTAFPLLAAACPDWSPFSSQRGCAKVHVAMRWDFAADGQHLGGGSGQSHLVTSVPIFVGGQVPNFRFPLTGKPIVDTRMQVTPQGEPEWQPNTPFAYAEYVFDENGNVEVMLSKGIEGQTFQTGSSKPKWGDFGQLAADESCIWLNAGKPHDGGWPGPSQTIPSPYVFKDDNGKYQLLAGTPVLSCEGSGRIVSRGEGWVDVVAQTPVGFGAEFGFDTEPGDMQGEVFIDDVFAISPGQNYIAPFKLRFVPHGDVTVGGSGEAQAGETQFTTGQNEPALSDSPGKFAADNGRVWLCLGTPSGFAYATNPSNNALCAYDYLTDTDYGMHVDPSRIDLASVNAAANICEEQVTVYMGPNGGILQENRYSCDGVFDQSQARGDVMEALCASMAGCIIPPGDQYHLQAGAYQPPSITLTDADLRGPIKADFRISKRDICNGVRGKFLPSVIPTNTTQSQPAAWHWTDFPAYQANGMNHTPNWLAEDGGQAIWKDVSLTFTSSIWMAQRLAKIIVQTLRYQVMLHLPCKLSALQVRAGDTITFIHKRWAALPTPPPTTFFVTQATPVIELESNSEGESEPTIGVDLVLRETAPDVYEFTAPISANDQGEYSWYGSLGTIRGG